MTKTYVHLAPLNHTIVEPILKIGSEYVTCPIEQANAWGAIDPETYKLRAWAANEKDCVDAAIRLAPTHD